MSVETTGRVSVSRPWLRLIWLLAPVVVLIGALWWLVSGGLLANFNNGAPPIEGLTVERTILDSSGVRLLVRAGGSEPMKIAQVQVDSAYWNFTQDPGGRSNAAALYGSPFHTLGSWAKPTR